MATKAAHKRLTREYASLTANPIEYITAHPSESNILEWHYILTGPANTPYHHGQYWGTLVFPPDYPFAPPAIRMHTPSGRFRPSERLCLSISDFHPKSFNPAWEVSTILLGVLSFMTSEEMTTGSVSGTDAQRKEYAGRTRWWNSTGGGSTSRTLASGEAKQVQSSNTRGFGAIKAGDGGKRFREQWAEMDEENWKWMEERRVDPQTGKGLAPVQQEQQSACSPETAALRMRANGSNAGLGAVVEGGQAATEAGRGWLGRNWGKVVMATLFAYVIAARLLSDAKA
ncbi:Ubiquitin-conjugating enzyme E2 6 [Friedmanniomyces endolithicus]|uniref:Ubiquitin-conjugating enzyme E2 6 n=1 Tax=Rachicladosporium monterosium TaxID=1507873 RepID=A0ABR0LA94_9PEZI|nr:Ubiquitin-conjugating enzyme E2 6 [Friedmanniomyces endolithicus]KAK5145044.1 Ubiquitin-conjugating enzyme E2 6 [Rachicladosporium monterosium]